MKYTLKYIFICLVILVLATDKTALAEDPWQDAVDNSPSLSGQTQKLIHKADSLSLSAPEAALELALEALDRSKALKDQELMAKAELVLANVYYYLWDLQKAIVHYQLANQLFLKTQGNLSEKYISTLGYIGNCYHDMKEEVLAFQYFDNALGYARQADNKGEIAANLANLGLILTVWGDYGKAIEYMEEALSIDMEFHEEEVVATDFNTIGKIYSYWGQPEQAVHYYEKALEIDQRLNNNDKISIRLNSIGTVYMDEGDYNKALTYFFQALQIDSLTGSLEKTAVRYHNIGYTYYLAGDRERSRYYLQKAEGIFRESNDPINLCSVLHTLGNLSKQAGAVGQSMKYFEEGLNLSRDANLQHLEQKILTSLAEAYYLTGEPGLAYRLQKQGDSLSDILFSLENSRQISAYEARYKVTEAKNQAEIYRKDASLKKKRMIILAILASAAIVFLVIMVLYIRLKHLAAHQEKELNEQKALALNQELEIRNKELAISAMNIMKNNETIMGISTALQNSMGGAENSESIRAILGTLRSAEHSTNWEDFEKRFTQVHQDFYGKLDEKFPDLSPNERRLCAYLKLHMTTKEIASITFQSVKSINVARTRLRKKLGLANTDQSISTFLADL